MGHCSEQLALFNAPQEEGVVSDRDRGMILEMLKGLKGCSFDSCLLLDAEAKNFLRELYGKNRSRGSELEKTISRDFQGWIIESLCHQEAMQNFREILKTFKDSLTIKDSSHWVMEQRDNVKTLGDRIGKRWNTRYFDNLEIIGNVMPEIISKDDWENSVTFGKEWARLIMQLAMEPRQIKENDCNIVEGFIVGASDWEPARFDGKPYIEICGWVAHCFDKPIRKQGVNVSLIAPVMSSTKNLSVELRGKDARMHDPVGCVRNAGENGIHRRSGIPGGKGGHLHMRFHTFYGEDKVSFNLSGGNGGCGQNGGDGAGGADINQELINRAKRGIMNRENKALCLRVSNENDGFWRGVAKNLSFAQSWREVYEVTTIKAQKGGNAGIGGAGGRGGKVQWHIQPRYENYQSKRCCGAERSAR